MQEIQQTSSRIQAASYLENQNESSVAQAGDQKVKEKGNIPIGYLRRNKVTIIVGVLIGILLIGIGVLTYYYVGCLTKPIQIVSQEEDCPQTPLRQNVTVFFMSCNRYDLLNLTIASFLKMNTYPVEALYVVEDGPYRKQMAPLMEVYPKIRWLILGSREGQLRALDEAYKNVRTKWIFHSEDDWEYIKPGFIEMSMQYLNKYSNVHNIFLRKQTDNYDPKTLIVNDKDWMWGFSLNPHLGRTADYLILKGGYTGVTQNRSFGRKALWQQVTLTKLYKKMGFRCAQAKDVYIRHLGEGARATRLRV